MRNSAVKRIIAVLLCLVVFASSELTGLTNIVGDLFAEETTTGADEGERDNAVETIDVEDTSEDTAEEVEAVSEEVPLEEATEPEEPVEATEPTESEPEAEAPAESVDEEESSNNPEAEENGETPTVEAEDKGEETSSDTENEDNADNVTDVEDAENKEDSAGSNDTENKDNVSNIEDAEKKDDTTDVANGEEIEDTNPSDNTEVVDGEEVSDNIENQEGEEIPADEEIKDELEVLPEEEEEEQAFDEKYEDGQVVIHVEAEPGVVPNGTELYVKQIIQQDVDALEDEDEIAQAEELNVKYENIKSELELTVADDITKEIAGFVAYDVNFLLTNEDGETIEVEPDGEVSVSMEFEEAYLPEEIAQKEETIDIESIDVIHMEEAKEDEESETGLKSEVVADADVSTTENAVEKAEFTTDSSRTFVITWTENDQGEREYICETEEATIRVTAAKGVLPDNAQLKVIPILAENEATKEQYQDVEKKLLEKAESEAYNIAGFLAYDISFADETGAELEPTGEVKVAIDYKKAVIPEELKDLSSTTYALDEQEQEETVISDAEDASKNNIIQSTASTSSITVMHFEEDETGEVTKVVDIGAEGKVTELKSTEDQKVTSTEFVTGSFSTFTIVWIDQEYNQRIDSIEIKFYDIDTNEELELDSEYLNRIKEVTLGKNEVFNISDVTENGIRSDYYQVTDTNGDLYTFSRADYEISVESGGMKGVAIDAFRCSNYIVEYGIGKDWSACIKEFSTFYFLYKKGGNSSQLETVETINNNDFGITMRMIDYEGIGPQQSLLGDKDKWWNNGNITQGAVERRLNNDGYPVTTGMHDSTKGESLAPLFGGASLDKVTSKDANHLFLKDVYDEEGYFEYSSFENYAYLNNNDFIVYNALGTPTGVSEKDEATCYWLKRGNFLPFNQIKSEPAGKVSPNKNLYDEYGNELSDEDERKGEVLYQPIDTLNFCFGMYIEAVFAQPAEGKAEFKGNKSPMIFEFNGDDDLWVFIDDTLILDIGGSHHACSGTIDFSNGTVEVKGVASTTIKEQFRLSGALPNGDTWNDEEADKFFSGNTFTDYSTHRIKIFYMEHGAQNQEPGKCGNASNLHIRMNLPTVPKGTIEIEKQLDNTDKEKYKDVEFAFQVFAQKIDNPGTSEKAETYFEDQYVTLANPVDKATGEIIRTEKKTINGVPYEDVFYLKPGQVAQFKNLQDNRKYYVKEIGVKSGEYDKVTITGATVEEHDNQGTTTTSQDIKSLEKTVGERPRVVYINKCSIQNSRELQITKQMLPGQSSEDTFTFKVSLGGKPFDGQYALIDAEGTTQENLQASSDGEISGVPVGGTVVIDQIMSDTTFKVEEVKFDPEKYTLEGITGKEGTYGKVDSTGSDTTILNGKILLGKDAEITVTNSLNNVQGSGLSITKKIQSESSSDAIFTFKIFQMENEKFEPYKGEYFIGNEKKSTDNGAILIKAGETALLEMKAGTQFKVEEVLDKNYKTPIISVIENTTASPAIKENEVIGTVIEGKYADITITNILKYSWEIIKQSKNGNQPLENAGFELSSKDGTKYYGLSEKSTGIVKWYDQKPEGENKGTIIDISETLKPGEYTLTEYQEPLGYTKVEGNWTIKISDDSVPTIEGSNDNATNALGKPEIIGTKTTFYIMNDIALYELPSTGGAGIHWYMVSGTLLMMAGILILYKRKYAGRC